LLLVIFIGCSDSSGTSSSANANSDIETEATKAMATELADLVKNGDPKQFYNWNSQRAELAKAEITKASAEQYFNKFFGYSYENLNAGNSEQVVGEIESVMKQSKISLETYQPGYKVIFDLLALAYLRDGEQKNCINNHTPYSCLVPLMEEGQHQNQAGSEGAINIMSFLNKKHPEDLQNRWLLNLAHMTLGTYPDGLNASELIKIPDEVDFPRFDEIAMSTGVAQHGLSGGVCVDDFNNDGFLDIFATSYGMEDQAQYFENDKNGGFTNKTASAGINGITGGLNCIHADYDGDGNRDVLILRGGWFGQAGRQPNSLLKGRGDGTFEDVTYAAGLTSKLPCQTAVFFDYDLDGDLDLFFGNEGNPRIPINSELYQNKGDGTFSNKTLEAGINVTSFVKGVTAGDYNNDGYPDLYISALGSKNKLYQNQKNGLFKEVGQSAGVTEPAYSFPTWFFDVNNDGLEDIFVGSFDTKKQNTASHDYAAELLGLPVREEQPRLFINQADGTFKDKSISYGVRKSMYAMGSNYGDLDNDGYLDFYIGTGTPHLGSTVPNRMFRNVDGKSYEEVTYSGGFGHVQKGHGVAFADLNNDGDQEVYAVMGGAVEGDPFTNVLFDVEPNDNNYISIRLKSNSKNVDAIGARVSIKTSNNTYHRTMSTGGSFGSNPLKLEVGLGQCDPTVSINVHWPDKERSVTSLGNISVNKSYLIQQSDNSIKEVGGKSVAFKTGGAAHHHRH
jgi:hypothetical protein